MPERFTAKFESADSHESADSLRENHNQIKSQEEFDSELLGEIQSLDSEIELHIGNDDEQITTSKLPMFVQENYPHNPKVAQIASNYIDLQTIMGVNVSKMKLKKYIDSEIKENTYLNKEESVKAFKEQLISEGKSSEQVLKILLDKFGNETEVPILINNWKKFLRLHELAKTKSPQEQRVIHKIISNADFTSESSFSICLNSITSNAELSDQTKLEISMEFNDSEVRSVAEMDSGLRFLKNQKEQINSALNTKIEQADYLDSEIESIKKELDDLPFNDPKRKELESQLSSKKELLKNAKDQVDFLEIANKRDVAFEIRSGFFVKLNPDNSRSLKIPENFSLKLPSNALPFTSMKNRRAVNLSFVCSPLLRLGILNEVFSPNLESGTVPMKVHRDMGHFILNSLGIDYSQLLSESDITQLDKDLSRLMDSHGLKSPKEHLSDLGIYDIADQSLDKKQFKRALVFVKENRHLKDDVFPDMLKTELE